MRDNIQYYSQADTGIMAPPPAPGVDMTPFELERMERIKKNQERMRHLDLDGAMARVVDQQDSLGKRPPTKRGLPGGRKKRQSDLETMPPRRSSRLKGEHADGSEIVSEKAGQIVVGIHGGPNSLLSNKKNGATTDDQIEPRERHTKDDIPFTSENASAQEEEKMIQVILQNSRQKPPTAARGKKNTGMTKPRELEEKDVAKVTKSSTTHLAFMPRGDSLILASADKRGSVGLWRVEAHDEESDGVLSFTPHSQYISGLAWGMDDLSLITSSYDGSVRKLDLQKSCFAYEWGDEDMEYSAMSVSENQSVLYLGNTLGEIDRIDIRCPASRVGKPREIHARKVNTIHVDPCADHLVATSSTDSSVSIWDMRSFGPKSKPLSSGSHRQTCQSAYFAPDGSQRLVTTSFDNTIRIWDGKKSTQNLTESLSIRHDNQTGRWVLPLRAIWSPDASSIIVGNMKRFVDIFDSSTGSILYQMNSEFMSAIPARNCAHASFIASATASGRIHIWRH